METQDFTDASGQRVDRLTAVKQVLDDFLSRRKGDRVGLIFFGSAAFVQAPFTEDLEACRTLLQEAQVRMAGPQTVFGDAIGLALTVFARAEGVQERVLIVLTDGNDTNSKVPPARAAEIARAQNITIYTVAVGDPTAAGEEKLDKETLKAVATTTGGCYYHASDRAALADIYTQLDALPTRPVQILSHRPRRDLFHWPLALGLGLSLVYHAAWMVRHAWSRPPGVSPPAPVVTASVFAIWLDLQQLHFLRPWWLLALVPALLLVWAIRRQTQRQASEAGCFARLGKACRAGDAVAACNALLCWLDCIHSGPGLATLADDLLAPHPDADLRRHVEALQAVALYRDTSWNGTALAAALHRVRRAGRSVSVGDAQLPALNPH